MTRSRLTSVVAALVVVAVAVGVIQVSSAGGTASASSTRLVVDAVGDAGPDTAHWNTPLAVRLRRDRIAAFLWAGDVRNTGTVAEWKRYNDNYGPIKSLTLPTPGNHDWGLAKTGYNAEFASGAPWADVKTYCNAVALPKGWGLFSINTYTLSACLPKLTARHQEDRPHPRASVQRWNRARFIDGAGADLERHDRPRRHPRLRTRPRFAGHRSERPCAGGQRLCGSPVLLGDTDRRGGLLLEVGV